MTADLAEEHSTATLAAERLENEQAERLKLEKEKGDLAVSPLKRGTGNGLFKEVFFFFGRVSSLQDRNRSLQSTNEKMEMELLYSRAVDINGAMGVRLGRCTVDA